MFVDFIVTEKGLDCQVSISAKEKKYFSSSPNLKIF